MSEIKTIAKRTFVQTAIAAAEELPFVSAAKAALDGAMHMRLVHQFNDFLQEVSRPLAFGNVEEASKRIAADMDKPWVVAGLEEGWTKSVEAMHPLAKRCIYQMVVDYLAQQKAPDRFHRQFANLLIECDEPLLNALLVVSDHLATNEWRGADIVQVSNSGDPDPSFKPFQLLLEHRTFITLEDTAEEVGELCVRHRFGENLTGFAGTHPKKDYRIVDYPCCIRFSKAPLWKKLRDYLEPVRLANAAAAAG